MFSERLREEFQITASQWRYYRFWLFAVVFVEALMLIMNSWLVLIYGGVAGAFAVGLLLRVLKLYPGDEEPLILDLSGAGTACLYALAANGLGNSGWRFLLICCSSLIILPHLIFIAREK